jgi:hypothetical protein
MNDYIYTKAGTDITIRWKKLYSYTPASEQELYKKKWADFRAQCNKSVDDLEAPLPAKPAQIYELKRK